MSCAALFCKEFFNAFPDSHARVVTRDVAHAGADHTAAGHARSGRYRASTECRTRRRCSDEAREEASATSTARMTAQQPFRRANTTHDGHLTKDQAQAAHMTSTVMNWNAIDKDQKGYVTMDDLHASAAQRAVHHTGTEHAQEAASVVFTRAPRPPLPLQQGGSVAATCATPPCTTIRGAPADPLVKLHRL